MLVADPDGRVRTPTQGQGPDDDGVSDGARTRDHRDHNPELYQLSYAHHAAHQPPLRGPWRADRGSLTDL